MTSTAIRTKLEQIAGVMPSEGWLLACQAFLRLTNEDTADAVLHQVLHADLRDVVRPLESNSTTIHTASHSPILLRSSLQQSMSDELRKVTLPENFRLLVQVEELLDVSLNAEARYSLGPASATAPTPVGNQRSRLLKLYMADGHLPPTHLLAMETTPIPNLSVHSLAGIKVLLRGPLEIRHGLIQLNPSNTTVLGGSVSDLVVIQRKALEQARRLAGVGVDPTVKALCWNNADDALLNQEEDEGESSSGDVAAPPRQQQEPHRFTLPAATSQVQHPPHNMPSPKEQVQQRTITAPTRDGPTMMAPQSQLPIVPTHQPHSRSQPAPLAPRHQVMDRSTLSNPYARTRIQTTTTTHPPNGSIPLEHVAPTSINKDVIVERKESCSSNRPRSSTTTRTTTTTKSTPTQVHSSQESNGGVREPLSFEELTGLLCRITKDRQLYEKYQDYVFVVPAKMKGRHVYFNIEKKKKRRKNGEKYEYIMKSHFSGAGHEQLVTVLVADSVLRPHFQLAPGAMRQLSREDRNASQKLVDEGGTSVIAALSKLQSWELCLCRTANDFFAEPVAALDQEQPLLRVLKPSERDT